MTSFSFSLWSFLDVAATQWLQNALSTKGVRQRMFWSDCPLVTPCSSEDTAERNVTVKYTDAWEMQEQ